MTRIGTWAIVLPAVFLAQALARGGEPGAKPDRVEGKYAAVNGLKMYYEVHGSGRPLVLLHGAFGWAAVHPLLASGRQVIAAELQGHGHTADIDRPLSYEQLAADVAELLRHLKIEQADVFGYSMGGNVGLALAIRYPKLVRKLAIFGSFFGRIEDAFDPATRKQFESLPADFAPPVLKEPYDRMAPDPKNWPVLVAKVKKMGLDFKGFSRDDIRSIQAHVLVALGDRDGVRLEHVVELYRLIPNSQLAVFPNGDHFMPHLAAEKLFPTVAAFLDSPLPEAKTDRGK